jgi:hypothetical protein
MRCDRIEETAIEVEPAPTWASKPMPDARPDWRIVDRRARAGASLSGHSAQRRALRVASRRWSLPRRWVPVGTKSGAPSRDSPR